MPKYRQWRLWGSWSSWADHRKIKIGTEMELSERLKLKGFVKKEHVPTAEGGRARGWEGLALLGVQMKMPNMGTWGLTRRHTRTGLAVSRRNWRMCVKMGFVLEMARVGALRRGATVYVLQIMPGQDYVRLYKTPAPRCASLCHSRTFLYPARSLSARGSPNERA